MKAKLVSENISFERNLDTKESLGIGNEKIREIKKAFGFVSPLIESMKADQLNFKEFRWKVDTLKDTLDVIIVNHFNEKFGLDLKFVKSEENMLSSSVRRFARGELKNGTIIFNKNGPGNSFWVELYDLSGEFILETAGSSMLSTLDQKVSKVLKKHQMI